MSHEMSLGSCFVAIVYMLCHVRSCVFCMFLLDWKGILGVQVGPVVRHGFLNLRNMSCRKGS